MEFSCPLFLQSLEGKLQHDVLFVQSGQTKAFQARDLSVFAEIRKQGIIQHSCSGSTDLRRCLHSHTPLSRACPKIVPLSAQGLRLLWVLADQLILVFPLYYPLEPHTRSHPIWGDEKNRLNPVASVAWLNGCYR